MATHINIQVSTEDLLALLGDDPEVRLTIQSSIVQQFATSHLKAIVNHELVKEVEKDLKTALAQEIKDQVGTWNRNNFTVHSAIEERIKNLATTAVALRFQDLIEAEIEKRLEALEPNVAHYLNSNIKKRVDAEVQRRLEVAAKS